MSDIIFVCPHCGRKYRWDDLEILSDKMNYDFYAHDEEQGIEVECLMCENTFYIDRIINISFEMSDKNDN